MIDSIITGVVVGALTILATAWFAFKRFRSEGLWRQKFDAYTSLFEAMNEIMEELDQLIEAEIAAREISSEDRSALAATARKARLQIKKISRIGSFILPDQAQKIVTSLLKELDAASSKDTYFEHLDESYGALKKAVDELKIAARTDLGV